MSTISILTAVHNEELYVSQTLDSILAQSHKDWELIVVNDGSTDKTGEIVARYADDDPRITLVSPGKIGKNAAFNVAFEHSTGDWITFFAGDDEMCPDSLRDRIGPVEDRNPSTERIVVTSKLKTFSADPKFDGLIIPRGENAGNDSGGAILFSRAFANIAFPLPESLPNEDMWTGLCLKHFADNVCVVPVVTYNYRIHAGNSVNRTDSFSVASEKLRARQCVYDLFRQKFASQLSNRAVRQLEQLDRAQKLRYAGRTLRLVLLGGVEIRAKLNLILTSNAALYNLRMSLWALFSGWR